jgi:Delta-aminolevulinic acid dehydratase
VQDLLSRPRRNRRSGTIRGAISETHISPANLILPVFVHDGDQNIPIDSMPGVSRLGWRTGLLNAVAEARSYGVNQVVIFPKVAGPAGRQTGVETLRSGATHVASCRCKALRVCASPPQMATAPFVGPACSLLPKPFFGPACSSCQHQPVPAQSQGSMCASLST